jgi:serine/threonine-protein kinase
MVLESLRKLFRYDIIGTEPVSGGGCGHVWHGTDLLYGRDVAIKTIAPELTWDVPEKAARTFQKEAVAAARLGELSPNIVKVTDLGVIDNVLFYVMDWLTPDVGYKKIDMGERVGKMTLATCKSVIMQAAEAISIAHENGIVHSDLAPQNIVFDVDKQCYLVSDFGLLKIVEEKLVSQGSGSLLRGGRRHYFPPEVLSDIRNVSKASDVYALAVTLRVFVEGASCLSSSLTPTPQVLRIKRESRDAPDQVRQLLTRFIDGHTTNDTVEELISFLHKVPT